MSHKLFANMVMFVFIIISGIFQVDTGAQSLSPIIFVKQTPVSYTGGTIADPFNNVEGHFPSTAQPVGGGLFRLDPDGTLTNLTPFEHIAVRDPEISYDATKVIFSMKHGITGKWQLYEMNIDGSNLYKFHVQESQNYWDPSYLPDGRILFVSDRLEAIARINENIPANQLPEGMLFVMNHDGSNTQTINAHPRGTFNPQLGENGLIYFTQWDLNDLRPDADAAPDGRSYSRFLIWEVLMDGSREGHPIFGQHLVEDFAGGFMEARELTDGSQDMIGVWAQARYTWGAGSIVRFHPRGDEDAHQVTWLTPQEHYYNLEDNSTGRYRSPYPLADGRIIASFAAGSVWDDGSRIAPDFDLVLLNDKGHEVIHADPDFWDWQPVEVVPRAVPAMKQPTTQPEHGLYAIVNTMDVELRHLNGDSIVNGDRQPTIERGEAAAVRLYFLGRATPPYAGGDPNNQNPSKTYLGEAPVLEDGSFAAIVPARTQIMWEVVDANGELLVEERVWSELAPGEIRTCAGCHTPYDASAGRKSNMALLNPVNLTSIDVDRNDDGIVDLIEEYLKSMGG